MWAWAPSELPGTSLFVIPKALFGGAPSTVGMTTFNTPFSAGPDNGFAIQAAVNWQGNPGKTPSVMADSRDDFKQVCYKLNGVNDPGATQTASSNIAGSGIGEYASQRNVRNTYIALITAVPEPETYALMLAGLAAVTAVARRRNV